MTDKTVSEGASLPRSSAKVLRRVLSAAAVLFALCLVLAAPAAAEVWDGTSVDTDWYSESSPATEFTISTAAQLAGLAQLVNGGNEYFEGKTIELGADIDLGGKPWTPIGSAYKDHGFMGNFDGKTYKISNLNITTLVPDSDGYVYAGLFGVTEGTDTENQNFIKNLIIENVYIETTGDIVAAAIAYPYYTVVDNITVCGDISITGGDYTSGVLAYTRRCIDASNLYVVGNAGSFISGKQTIGGVISDIQMNGGLVADYSNFCVSGVTISGEKSVGGISGIIAAQTLNGAKVENVVLNCDDSRVGIVSGSLGSTSTITGITVTDVSGASSNIGGAYEGGNPVEAKISDTYYATFSAAVGAAQTGDTITLVADYTTDDTGEDVNTDTLTFTGLTLDLNQHTLGVNKIWSLIFEGSDFTIKNGIVEGVNGETNAILISYNGPSTNVLIEDVISRGTIYIYNTHGITLRNVTATSTTQADPAVRIEGGSTGIVIESGTYIGGDESVSIQMENPAEVTVQSGIFSTNPVARVTYESGEFSVSTLQDAVTFTGLKGVNNPTITLLKDVDLTSHILISGKTLTLDLDGHTISSSSLSSGSNAVVTVLYSSDVTIKDGTIKNNGTSATSVSDSTLYVSAGASVTLENVDVISELTGTDALPAGYAIRIISSYVDEYGGSDVILNSGSNVTSNKYAVYVQGLYSNLTVNEEATVHGDTYGISGNSLDTSCDGTAVIINGGEITGNSAGIYQPQNGTLTIKGGNITGPTAVLIRSGSLEIIDGALDGTLDEALVIENSGLPPAYDSYEEISSVSVSGGTFTSLGENAVRSSTLEDDAVAITGFITGGTFSSDVSDHVAEGYSCFRYEGNYIVAEGHVITWMHPNGTVLKKASYPADKSPSYDGDTPVNESTDQYTYDFNGWNDAEGTHYAADEALPAVTADATYTANFTATPIVYNISFHIDEEEYASLQFPFGTDLSNIDALIAEMITMPEKIGYTFTGWGTSIIPSTMPAWDIILKSGFVINTYNITFIVDGAEYAKIEQEYNTTITKPSEPEKTGYTFAGWSPDVPTLMPAENRTVTAQWNLNQYNITLVDGEAELSTIQTNFNSSIADAIADVSAPTKTGYTFIGWNLTGIPELMPAEDITIPVEWKVNQYTITFDTKGGNELAAVKKDYNTSVVEADLPTPEMIGYTFAGWNETFPFLMPAEDIELEAKWTPIKYLITWVNDTATLKTEEVAYGETPVFGEDNPTKEDTDEYSYEFVGWEPEIVPVAGEATYKANFTATPIPYTVSFVVDGEGFGILTYGFNESLENIGEDIKAEITDPEKLGHTFIGWNLTALPKLMPAGNLIVPAEWKVNQYNITFDTQGGNALAAVKKDYNTSVAEADLPTPEKTGYTFAGWNTMFPFLMPAEDIELEAKWTVNNYTVVWYGADGKTLSTEKAAFNTTPIYHGDIPTKAENETHTFTFVGWNPTVGVMTENGAEYTAVFTPVAKVIDEEDTEVEPEIVPEIKPADGDKVTVVVTPSAPSTPGTTEPETPTTIVNTEKNTATIVDSSGVTMEIGFTDKPEITTDETTGETGVTGAIKEIKVTYPVKAAEVDDHIASAKPVEKPVTQTVEIKFNGVIKPPKISSEINTTVEQKVQNDLGSSNKILAMITASHDNLEAVNNNISSEGIVVTFTIPEELVKKIGGKDYLKVFHVKTDKKSEALPDSQVTISGPEKGYFTIAVKAAGFSSYVVGYEEKQEYNDYYDDEDDTPVTPEKPEDKPTETPSDDPTDVPGDVPSDIPGTTPSEPGKSPAPILGVLAALGAAVVLRRK